MKTLLALLVIGFLGAADKQDDATKKDLEKFQGTWKVVEGEIDGEKAPDDLIKGMTITFKDNKVMVKRAEKTEPEQTLTLDPSKSPKEMDVTPKAKGIYEIDGDTLKVRFTKDGAERPTKLAGKTKPGEALLTLKREKP